MNMSNLKSLFLALALLPTIQAAPVADVHVVYKTVTVFESVTAVIPTGVTFDDQPEATYSASSYGPVYPSSSAVYSYGDDDEDDDSYDSYDYSSASASATASSSFAPATGTSSAATSSATSSSIFDSSSVKNGIATFYSVGADNCGTSSTDSDYVCAISQQMYNTVASSDSISEYCGHLINITYNGKTIQVKVVDSCESCDATHLDLSPTAFQALASEDLGVIDIQWEWAS